MQKTAICENERKINGEEKVTEIRYIKGIKQQIETERKVKTKNFCETRNRKKYVDI